MNLPKGFKAAIRRGERPRWPWDGESEVFLGETRTIAIDSLSGEPTLTVTVDGLDRKAKSVLYAVTDLRPNLLKATLPSRPGKFDQDATKDRDAAMASAYTDSTKRAMRGGHTRIGDDDIFIGPEPEAVSEEDLREINARSKQAWDALKQQEQIRRQAKATITRVRRIVDTADKNGKALEVLREMQDFLNKLEQET